MRVFLLMMAFQIPPLPAPSDEATDASQVMTTLDRAAEKLAASPDGGIRLIAESLRRDVATLAGAPGLPTAPVPYLADLQQSAKSLEALGAAPRVDAGGIDALRDLAEDLRIKAEAVRSAPPPFAVYQAAPAPPPLSAPAPLPSKSPPMAYPRAPSKAMLAAQSAHLTPGDLRDLPPPPPPPPLNSPAMPFPPVPSKIMPQVFASPQSAWIPTAGADGSNPWMKAVRILTALGDKDQPGLDLYIIGRGRAAGARVRRADLRPLGISFFDGLLAYGNYMILALQGEPEETIERSRLRPIKVEGYPGGGSGPQVIRIVVEPKP